MVDKNTAKFVTLTISLYSFATPSEFFGKMKQNLYMLVSSQNQIW